MNNDRSELQPFGPTQPGDYGRQAVPNGRAADLNSQGYTTSYQNAQAPSQTTSGYTKRSPGKESVAAKFVELTYFILIIVESILALRFLFKLLGANPENVFANFLYQVTEVFTLPFVGLFGVDMQNSVQVSGYKLEFTTLVAMGVYALLAYIVIRLIDLFR